MAVSLVSFTQRASAGTQAVTGVGFEPKAVIIWTTWRSGTGLFDGAELCEGASDGVKQFARCMSVEVANAAGSVGLTFDAILRRLTTTTGSAPSELCAASLTSLDSDGFTLDWSVSDAGGATVYAIAIGGTGLDAALLTGSVPSGTTTALTGAGFEPTAAMVWPGYTGVPYAHGLFAARDSWGFATSVAQVCSATIEIAAFGNKKRTMGTVVDAKVATVLQENGILGGGIASNHRLLSFGTDGLSLSDWHGSFGGTADMAVLCLRGVVVAVGEVIIPTSPGTVSETAGVAPELLLLQTVDLTLGGNAVSNGARFGIGCWTDDAQVTVGAGSDTTGEFTAAHDDTAIRIYQPGATAGASTLRVAATVASIEADGFTLDCTTVTGSSTPIQYLAIGPSDAPISSRNLLTGSSHTVEGSDNLIVGAHGTIAGDKNALFALCDDSPAPEIAGDNTFKVCAETIDLSADGNVSVDAADILFNGTSVKNAITTLTGDVTATGPGSVAGTIANDAVTNAKAANMAAATIKGRAVGAGTGDPTDLTGTQVTAILDNVVGDSGSGGTKGLVPAPGAGDAAAGKFLKADGTFAVPPGSGGVTGPVSSTDRGIATYNGTGGSALRETPGPTVPSDGRIANVTDPSSAQDAATKNYVDALAVNLGKRGTVRAATTANITISTALNNGDTLDGVSLVTGDLVLVKDQSAPADNGVYVVGVSPARSTQFDTYNEHPGSLLTVEEGTSNADTLWLCTSNVGGTIGVTALAFSQLVIAAAITQLTGDVTAGPGSGSQAATIANNAVTTAKVNNDAVTLAKIANAAANSRWLGSGSGGSGADYTENTFGAGLTAGASSVALSTPALTRAITFTIDGGGAVPSTGIKGDVSVPYACTITGVRMLADQSGSAVIDIWKDTYANYPPTGADSIVASAKPTISTATKSEDTTLTGWTTSISAGDTMRFNLDSITTIQRVVLILTVTVA